MTTCISFNTRRVTYDAFPEIGVKGHRINNVADKQLPYSISLTSLTQEHIIDWWKMTTPYVVKILLHVMRALSTTSHSSSESQIMSMIQLQKQESEKLNDEIQHLKQLYEAEREQRKVLARKCRELEDIMKKEGISSTNHPSAIASASRQNSEHAARGLGLEYRQHREALHSHQQNPYYRPSGYQSDHPAVYHNGAAPSPSQYNVPAVSPSQHLPQYPRYSTETEANNPFVGWMF
jgi:hypothetical protein